MKQDNNIVVSDNQNGEELQPMYCEGGGESDAAAIVSAVAETMSVIAGCYAVCKQSKERTRQIQMMTDVQLANITAKYKSFELLLNKVFGEREKALDIHYKTLDKAIASNDRELIAASIQGISNIVTKTPLEDLERLAHLYNDTSAPLLDF